GAATLAVRIGRIVALGRGRVRAMRLDTIPTPAFPLKGKEGSASLREAACSDVVVVGVRDQREEARALDRERQLTLVARLGAGDAARHDLAVLGEGLAQGVEILVIDLLDALGGELAELAAAEELGHGWAPQAAADGSVDSVDPVELVDSALPASLSVDGVSSSRRRRSERSGLSPFSSLFFMISDCSVSASSRRITRWRRMASLKRKVSTSSVSTSWPASMLSST